MTDATAAIEAKKDGLRQTQGGLWKLTLTLHPADAPPWLLTAPMGQRLAVVVAALEEDAEKQPEKPKERRRFEDMPLSQQAALRCEDKAFRDWLMVDGVDHAAREVRLRCFVTSRSMFDTNAGAADAWRSLDAQFLSETGRVTEARGG